MSVFWAPNRDINNAKHLLLMRNDTYQSTTLLAVVLLLLILFISSGYLLLIPPPDGTTRPAAMLAELRSNQETWENDRPLSFRYVVRRSCNCGSVVAAPYIATEYRGQKTASFRIDVEDGSGVFLSSPPDPVWISDIFGELVGAMTSEAGPIIEVSYDERYGYPAAVEFRYPQPDAYMRYEIQDFEILEHR